MPHVLIISFVFIAVPTVSFADANKATGFSS